MISWLVDPLDFRFMQLALIEVVIVGAVAGFLGTYVVTRGMAFVGDAITHAVFPGIVIAFLANVSLVIGATAFGVLTAMAISSLSLTKRIQEDTAIGVVFAAFFALGVVLISTTEGYTRDLTNILFGDILAVTTSTSTSASSSGASPWRSASAYDAPSSLPPSTARWRSRSVCPCSGSIRCCCC